MRGLAALSVALFHSLQVFNFDPSASRMRRFFTNIAYGPGDVLIFFVLSGFVLGLSILRGDGGDIGAVKSFLWKRFFRLFPMILASTALLSVYFRLSPNSAALSAVSSWLSPQPSFSAVNFIRNLSLFSTSINGVTWSLQVEAMFSIALPVTYFFLGRSGGKTLYVWIGLVLVYFFLGPKTFHLDAVQAPWAYLFACYTGVLLAFYRDQFRSLLAESRFLLYLTLLICGGICLATPHFGNHLLVYVLAVAFIIGVIATDLTPGVFRILDARPLLILGDISYSFYLLHTLFMRAFAKVIAGNLSASFVGAHPWLSASSLFVSSVAVCLPVSYLSYQIIERPFLSVRYKKETQLAVLNIYPTVSRSCHIPQNKPS